MPANFHVVVANGLHDPRTMLLAAMFLVIVSGVAALWLYRRRRPTPEQIECTRRLKIHASGRIVSGEILDLLPAPGESGEKLAPTLVYQYEVGGVTYQVSQALHLVPVALDPASYIPGWPVQVKYEPANPGNSIVACELWVGLGRPRGAVAGKAKAVVKGE